jgi:hypothetical protein
MSHFWMKRIAVSSQLSAKGIENKSLADRWSLKAEISIFDSLVKSRKWPLFVIPAKAGIQCFQMLMDSGFRRSDGLSDFLRIHHLLIRGGEGLGFLDFHLLIATQRGAVPSLCTKYLGPAIFTTVAFS